MAIAGNMTTVHRTTMFKVPDPENQKKLVEAYRVLEAEQQKVGLVLLLLSFPFPFLPLVHSETHVGIKV